MQRKDLEEHVTNTCEWRIMKCEYCEEQCPKCYVQVHITKSMKQSSNTRVTYF